MALTCPPMPGREYFQARSRIRPLFLFPSAGRQSWTSAMYRTQLEPLVHPGQPELSAQSPQSDRALNKKTSVTESFPRPYEPGSMSMALCLLWHLPAPGVTKFSRKASPVTSCPSSLIPGISPAALSAACLQKWFGSTRPSLPAAWA